MKAGRKHLRNLDGIFFGAGGGGLVGFPRGGFGCKRNFIVIKNSNNKLSVITYRRKSWGHHGCPSRSRRGWFPVPPGRHPSRRHCLCSTRSTRYRGRRRRPRQSSRTRPRLASVAVSLTFCGYFATLEHELLCCCSTSESRDVFFRFWFFQRLTWMWVTLLLCVSVSLASKTQMLLFVFRQNLCVLTKR